ncbi:MAG: aspartate--tRNA ligase [Leptospiraceae bacterium]|nr:aspartate--tRNA ligase [Leptospiraceae bacterium]MDW8305885.1 aspartate--tRNA ligase [Leptospiraceae bacterium]
MSATFSLFSQRLSCAELLLPQYLNQEVTLAGWVFHHRDQGGVIFIDLRDRSGVMQLVFDLSTNKELFRQAEELRSEDVILVRGVLRKRDVDSINPKIRTGELEVLVRELHVLNKSKPSPFSLDTYEETASEELRLEYRYLDLRRLPMQEAIAKRHEFTHYIRNFLVQNGFWEVETPILNKSTPEGARDFLVPSRLHPGSFYALPQSPQIFKQILMVGQIERYYQIARCFRDEDLRKDRQPEFTQIDLEMSFVNQNMLMELSEKMILSALKEVFAIEIPSPLPRLSYKEALENYGTDKPDIRFGMKLVELGDWAYQTEFQVFRQAVEKKGRLKALVVPGGAELSRKEIDELTHWVMQDFKAKGLAWIKIGEEGFESLITKYLSEEAQRELLQRSGAQKGDIIFFGAGSADIVFPTLSALRLKMAERFGLINPKQYAALWVVDFPLFELDSQTHLPASMHHPFTAPQEEDRPKLLRLKDKPIERLSQEDLEDLLSIRSQAYDLVLNGVEIGGGSLRIYDNELQRAVFHLLRISEKEAQDRFGFLLTALQYGAPPHGGIAFGLDRILMLALGRNSIREVIPFPKTQKGTCLMSQAPSRVDELQLREIHIKTLVPTPPNPG